MINALRGHLAEHGLVAARGPAQLKRLAEAIDDNDTELPDEVRYLGQMYLSQINGLGLRISELDRQMKRAATTSDRATRAQTMPGVGPVTALALETFAPDLSAFRRGRDFAAWLGLVPKQHSTGVVTVTSGCPRNCFTPHSSGNDLMPGGHRIGACLTEGPAGDQVALQIEMVVDCLLYTSPSPRDLSTSRMPSSA